MPSFIIVGYAWRILGRGSRKCPSSLPPWAALKKPILNRINRIKRNIFGNTWRLVLKLSNRFKKIDLKFKDFNFPVDKLTKNYEVYVSCFNYTWFKFIALYCIKLYAISVLTQSLFNWILRNVQTSQYYRWQRYLNLNSSLSFFSKY